MGTTTGGGQVQPQVQPFILGTDFQCPGICSSICLGVFVFPERRVRLFRNGRNQAVRIPRGFELPGKNAVIRKEGETHPGTRHAEVPAGSSGVARSP